MQGPFKNVIKRICSTLNLCMFVDITYSTKRQCYPNIKFVSWPVFVFLHFKVLLHTVNV